MLHISYLLISETPLTDVQSMITRGGILVGIVLVLEVLLLFGFSLYFFTAFWLSRANWRNDLCERGGDDRND